MYAPTASLVIESEDGIKLVTGISKLTGNCLRFRQVVAGKTVLKKLRKSDGLLYDDPLPLYIIDVNKLIDIDNIRNRAVYYIKEKNIFKQQVKK